MTDNLKLNEILNSHWLPKLEPILKKQINVEKFIGINRSFTLPKRENTFKALNEMKPNKVKIVIFGQDPYPREESACGIAFNDAKIKKWTDALNPSFRNIIKNILIHKGYLKENDKIGNLRKVVKNIKLLDPPDWFNYTIQQGVLWLNTSLTFTSKDVSDLNRHTAFWKPILESIIEILLEENDGLIFVLWGGKAKALKSLVNKVNETKNRKIRFVESNHPAVDSFHKINSFEMIEKYLDELNLGKIDWLPTLGNKRKIEEKEVACKKSKI